MYLSYSLKAIEGLLIILKKIFINNVNHSCHFCRLAIAHTNSKTTTLTINSHVVLLISKQALIVHYSF